ncbi:DUF2977 domain-containing protein [Staphylococcus saprophyticus]|nr:DUF2977 domain-containing protein [Staphylococcus saprophyticus]MDW4212538.1 DUF2977 domain-containing protein [Staphylococcus saprophyticus]MDW4227578.1 DUF2977 domain-containing protein [Staphylococcus saprophyticus]MDW4281744.1 DUF2977 domain-containing protein [Staphylococcus saprophyticus]MDW4362614.1 DUF2977 domain-containing protein [Staphylococcus saprophyticus]
MEIAFNEFKEIIGYARIGHIENAIEISEEELPYDFYDNYEPSKYIYEEYEGVIINPNYEPPNEIDFTESATDEVRFKEDKIKELEKENEKLRKEFNELKEKVGKVLSTEA